MPNTQQKFHYTVLYMYYKRKLIVGSPIVTHVATIAKAKIQFFK